MRTLRILPLLLVVMTYQAAAQPVVDATAPVPRVVQDDGRVTPRPAETQPCGLSLQACPTEDRNRVLLFLSVVSGGKRPLILR
jgi:hypothetical protein